MASRYYLYFLSNGSNSVTRVGLTRDLTETLSAEQGHLVYYEAHRSEESAKAREERIRRWSRLRKAALVATLNPKWDALSPASVQTDAVE